MRLKSRKQSADHVVVTRICRFAGNSCCRCADVRHMSPNVSKSAAAQKRHLYSSTKTIYFPSPLSLAANAKPLSIRRRVTPAVESIIYTAGMVHLLHIWIVR
jgi:hypothetical protein